MKKQAIILLFLMLGSKLSPFFEDFKAFNAYKNQEYDKSIKVLQYKQIENPHDPELNYNLGVAHYRGKLYRNAVEDFERVIEYADSEGPLRTQALYNAGNGLVKEVEKSLGPDWEKKKVEEKVIDKSITDLERAVARFSQVPATKELSDAKANREYAENLIEKLKEKKKQQQQNKGSDKDNKDNKDKNQQDKDKSSDSKDQGKDGGESSSGGDGDKDQNSSDQGNDDQKDSSGSDKKKDGKRDDKDKKDKGDKDKEKSDKPEEEDKEDKESGSDREQQGKEPKVGPRDQKPESGSGEGEEEKEKEEAGGEAAGSEGAAPEQMYDVLKTDDSMEKKAMRALLDELGDRDARAQKALMRYQSKAAASSSREGQKPW